MLHTRIHTAILHNKTQKQGQNYLHGVYAQIRLTLDYEAVSQMLQPNTWMNYVLLFELEPDGPSKRR